MTTFPKLGDSKMLQRLVPPGRRVPVVLDTDTYNEVDDQFALAYALLSPEACDLRAVYAAPFYNARSKDPKDGMLKSYEEILRVLGKMGIERDNFVFKGSESFLPAPGQPVDSAAARDLIDKAMGCDEPLYVLTIGAPTNVASALLLEPELVNRIVVVWLGGQPHEWPSALEFNLRQDISASQVLFDSGVPLVQIPCLNVAEHLRVTIPELNACLRGKSALGDYLCDIVASYHDDHFAWSKVIWDISAVAWLIQPGWVESHVVHAPALNDNATYSRNNARHFMRVGIHCQRDPVFRDLFIKFAD